MDNFLSLKDHVYNYISEKINKGELTPGDKLNETMIESELKISRTPIREALIQLASDGFLDNLPRKGFRVKALDENRAKDLYEIIGTLEGRAAVQSLPYIKPENIANMKFLAESMDSAIKQGLENRYYELQVEFHNEYLQLTPNKELRFLIEKLKNSFIRKYYLFENPNDAEGVLKETNAQHFKIIELIEENNDKELEVFIRDVHWNSSFSKLNSL